MQMQEDRQQMLNRRNGDAAHASHNWPSRILHEVPQAFEEGLATARLKRLADLIETLGVMDQSRPGWAAGKVGILGSVHGRNEVLGYLLQSGGQGYGAVCFREGQPDAYYLTGYGLVCWGWGKGQSMASVAANGHQNALQDVLTAEPVRKQQIPDLFLGDVTGRHVADALRQFVVCRDPHRAWWKASGLAPEAAPAPVLVPTMTPVPAPEPKVVALPGTGLTGNERWRAMMADEDVEGLLALCTEQVERLEGELATWRRRLAAAKALAGE